MFDMHDAFRGQAIKMLLLGILFFVIGCVVLGFSFKSDLVLSSRTRVNGVTVNRRGPHQAGTGERVLIFAIGALFATAGVWLPMSSIKWLQRGSDVIRRGNPVPMLVTFRQEVSFHRDKGHTDRQVELFATLQPQDPQAKVRPIVGMPIDLGTQGSKTNYPDFQNEPGEVFIDRDPSGPVVIKLRGKYYLSQKSFTRA